MATVRRFFFGEGICRFGACEECRAGSVFAHEDQAVKHLPLENGMWKSQDATVRTLNAHFDGKFIVLDEPARLKPNARVKVIAADADDADGSLAADFARLSEPAFRAIWDNPLDADYDHL